MEKDHLEILLEDMRGNFKLVLEGHQVLHNEIIRTREDLLEKIQLNTIRIEALNESLSNHIDAVTDVLKLSYL